MNSNSNLLHSLAAAGHPLVELASPASGSLLVLPFGGRILGLFAPDSEANLFWTNPMLAALETTRKVVSGKQWFNTGGDRTWLVPEREIHIVDPGDVLGT